MDECAGHVSNTLHAHMQALSNVLGDEQLAIAKTVSQEDDECMAETSRILNQATMRKAVSKLTLSISLYYDYYYFLSILKVKDSCTIDGFRF